MKFSMNRALVSLTRLAAAFSLGVIPVPAQSSTGNVLHGFVRDPKANGIPMASIVAQCAGTPLVRTVSANDGSFSMMLSSGGRCVLEVSASQFTSSRVIVRVWPATEPLTIPLKIEAVAADITVNAGEDGALNAEPDANAGAVVLRSEELATLPDDPDDLIQSGVPPALPGRQ
jgi:hypothetical protein